MPMNRQYLKARRKAMLSDSRKAERFSDWNKLALAGIAFSSVALIGWLPGCILSAIIDLTALYLCAKRQECGRRVALCALFFAIIGSGIAIANSTWRTVMSKLSTAAFAYLALSLFLTLLIMLGVWFWYQIRKGGRHS